MLGAVAALPTLIEFWVDRRKRAERVSLALEDEPVDQLVVRLAGLDAFLAANADLVDAVRDPAAYRGATTGNEVLVLGAPMTGKRSVAAWIAREARMDRLITVHNPRDADVLTAAKRLLAGYRRSKVLLLLPNLDRVFEDDDPELIAELDALIDHATEQENVLVVATATRFAPDSELDDLFGVKLVMPGTPVRSEAKRGVGGEAREVLRAVAGFYLDEALGVGCVLAGLSRDELVEDVLAVVGNPAEVEDILKLCRTSAVFGVRGGRTARPEISREVLRRATDRVIVASTGPAS